MSAGGKEPFRRNTRLDDLVATIIGTILVCGGLIGILVGLETLIGFNAGCK